MSLKNVINWNYERASWQWDLLCVVCLIFIFGTPKSWFTNAKPFATQTSVAVVQVDDCECEMTQ